MWFQRITLLLLILTTATAAFLQNPDFESPPLNLPENSNSSSSTFVLLGQNSTVPGWTYQGTVQQNYSKHPWQSYGHNLGTWGNDEPINLVLESQTTDSDTNSSCWPIIDTMLIKTVGVTLVPDNGNLLLNGGFESGPGFLPNSTEGVLLDSAPSVVQLALRQWTVMGTVRYINFHVPEGKAAIEILSASGIQTAARQLSERSRYNLTFTLGDANDGCEGDFLVGVEAGSSAQNFTVKSKAIGFSLVFESTDEPRTQIIFTSYSAAHTKDGVLCGPVVDEVILHPLGGGSASIKPAWLLVFALFCIASL
ncbi:PREDICTED: uncharacterized protein LOC109115987 [Tarenaya hassleriana]|uniref:uncharacterized protein LOC109115987 n=1 Tax=Tarenaya hassleriana TaxID=28532 RepID=UPI0008FD8C0B|nr:PREDICTED: uncharacterized protein LOC109115987 [Tarenaya hassleriana]